MRIGIMIGWVFAVGLLSSASCSGGGDDGGKPATPAAGSSGNAGSSGSGGIPNTCGVGLSRCANMCVNPSTDLNHCGVCNTKCGAGQTCTAGKCECTGDLEACGMACVNTLSDAANCGECGRACSGATPYCSQRNCVAACPMNEQLCGNSCAVTASDEFNCGFCGNQCQGGQACENGACGCPPGQTTCGGMCVDLATNGAHCGMCNNRCPASQTCQNRACAGGGGSGGSAGGGANPGGTSGAGGTSGSAGQGGSGGGVVVPPERMGCAITPGLIADFEEGGTMPVFLQHEGRTGAWEMFNDETQTNQKMVVESSGGTAECDKFALHVTGSGYSSWGAGFGFSLVGEPKSPTPYNAQTQNLTGIRFKAKLGSTADMKSPVRFNVSTPWTENSENPGGQCKPTTATDNKAAIDCYQHAGRFLPIGSGAGQLSTTFQTFTYCFDRDLYPLSLPSNLTLEQRNNIASNMLKVQFQFNLGKDYSGGYPADAEYPAFSKALPFDFWIDQVEFISGECPNTAMSPSNGSPMKPFPQNAPYGTCQIASNAAKFNTALVQAYATWTANFVRNNTVIAPEQSNVVTSESMGYGMMIAAAMGDKAAFDKFWGYVQTRMSGGLMIWKEGQQGSASDGDLDIAYALAMAAAQWGGSYGSAASSMAGAISSADIVGGVVRGGSSFQNSNFNPSYFIPAAFRKLGISLGSNYTFVNTNINAGAARVPTDWASPSNGNPSGAGAAQVTSDITDGENGAMGYDAARVPWRLGQDVCLGGSEGTAAVTSMVNYFGMKYDNGATIDLMKAGWLKSRDAPHMAAKDVQGSFIGPMGVAAMAANNAAMRDRAFRAMLDILESGDFNHTYFPSTIGFMTALIMSGNFPAP